MKILNLIKESYLLRRSYVSDDYQQALDNLTNHCTAKYKDYLFPSGEEYNGWVIPQKWSVTKALIKYKGKVIYNGLDHPLGVITNSSSFSGKITKKTLLKHLHFSSDRPAAIPFHFRLSYRPWAEDWGFCVPKNFVDSLPEGTFEIQLKTTLEPGQMVVREFTVPGVSEKTIIFVAHLDHPGMANDDLSGCAVGIALMNQLVKKKHHFTYKLILTQEILGSVFYLKAVKPKIKQLESGLFLEMLGNGNTLHLQKSLLGNTYFDQLCLLCLKQTAPNNRISDFRESAGNDEIAFEAPGIEIPMPSISRWPYPEYHTSDDNLTIISESKLQEGLAFVLSIISSLENDGYVTRNFDGLVSFANPKYDLYIDPGQIITLGLNQNKSEALFQYKMLRYLNGNYKISDLATIFNLDFDWLLAYYQKMQEKGLITIRTVESSN